MIGVDAETLAATVREREIIGAPDEFCITAAELDALEALVAVERRSREQAEQRVRFCPYCAGAVVDVLEGPCPGCQRAEAAEARADRLQERIETLAAMFGVPDGGHYMNDWRTRGDDRDRLQRELDEAHAPRSGYAPIPEITRAWERVEAVLPPSNPEEPGDPSTNLATLAAIAHAKWTKADAAVARVAQLEVALTGLESAVRILDVTVNEPAAKGLMSAEDYRAYLAGAWLGVNEASETARAALAGAAAATEDTPA